MFMQHQGDDYNDTPPALSHMQSTLNVHLKTYAYELFDIINPPALAAYS